MFAVLIDVAVEPILPEEWALEQVDDAFCQTAACAVEMIENDSSSVKAESSFVSLCLTGARRSYSYDHLEVRVLQMRQDPAANSCTKR